MKKLSLLLVLCVLAGSLSGAPAETAVDLDLSVMSGTVVYAQVYNMVCDPNAYLGKIIRMSGYYSYAENPALGIVYHACIIPDATACCAQGIEFVWAGEHAWPEDYPESGSGITVTGRLELYEEDGVMYLHLVDAELARDEDREG